jgi:hypothetical protein
MTKRAFRSAYSTIFVLCTVAVQAGEQAVAAEEDRIVIWPAGTEGVNPDIPEKAKPCNRRFYNIHNPYLTVYRPKQPNGTGGSDDISRGQG